jgi:putative molybdopterin biosynthesis protein
MATRKPQVMTRERPALSVSASWPPGDKGVDLFELARLISKLNAAPRMAAAAQGLEVSYRTAWGRLVVAERVLGLRLVERVKGHGSRPAPAGHALIAAIDRFGQEARARLEEPLAALAAELERLAPSSGQAPLRIAASHDLLLQRCVAERRAEAVTLRFVGSEDALAALVRGEADLAGFHRPTGERPLHREILAALGSACVAPLALREQGLIVAPGNPLRIRDVADLARSGLRFVNRQRGAATRAWLDRLLQQGGIASKRIAGYEIEEPTHLAVAATVAAGGADAGFGLRAAADRFGLGFVSAGEETYWLAGRAVLRRDPRLAALVAAVRQYASETGGYNAPPQAGAFRIMK